MKRFGKNLGSYLGETIDIRAVLRDIEAAAQRHGWTSENIYDTPEFKIPALHRRSVDSTRKIYISAGIHGDEPAGPLAALRLLQENIWPTDAEIILLPCLNPIGFTLNSRGNFYGTELNRDYRNTKTQEILAHIAWLERQPKFDLYFCLHEDWEANGFYLYEQNPDDQPSLAGKIIAAAQKVCPIDLSETIEGREAQGGIVRPKIQPHERPDWPEAFYLISHKSRLGYTLESPSDFSLTNISNTRQLGEVLYTQYALPFEIAAVILLVAMIAAISFAQIRLFISLWILLFAAEFASCFPTAGPHRAQYNIAM